MKKFRTILSIALCMIFLVGTTSCAVRVQEGHVHRDQGNHRGWYKNSNNPHHPQSTNPGHEKSKGKQKHKH